jgi:hypothetical protein
MDRYDDRAVRPVGGTVTFAVKRKVAVAETDEDAEEVEV